MKDMKEWVCVYVRTEYSDLYGNRILLVKKKRPSWQRNKLNLVGGSIEEGETPEEAAVREVKEESGITTRLETVLGFGIIKGDWGQVHCLSAFAWNHDNEIEREFGPNHDLPKIKPREGEDEEVTWWNFSNAVSSNLLIPNLKCIIPMFKLGIKGWTVYADEPDWESGKYEMKIEFDLNR